MAGTWPEDETPPLPDISPYISGFNLNMHDPPYGRETFEKYFEVYARNMSWRVKRKPRVRILEMRYGDKLITDKYVLEMFWHALNEYRPIEINNDNLNCQGPKDPKPGQVKVFKIKYQNKGNNHEDYVKHRRRMEGQTLDFGWDITSLMWGSHPHIWHMDKWSEGFYFAFWGLDDNESFCPQISSMGCDPSNGSKRNRMTLTYRNVRENGQEYSLGCESGDLCYFRGRWPQ